MQPLSRESIRQGLISLGLKNGDHVMVHSSFKSLGSTEGGPGTVIGAITDVVGANGTILVPTHISSGSVTVYLRGLNGIVDMVTAPSALGIITEFVRKAQGAARSIHPSHPVAAVGGMARELLSEHHLGDSPAGRKSPYGKLGILENGRILLIGVSTAGNTMLHTAEEYHTPYIFNGEVFDTKVRDLDGNLHDVKVKGYCVGVERNFAALDNVLELKGIIRRIMIGNASTTLIRAREMMEAASEALAENPFLLTKNCL